MNPSAFVSSTTPTATDTQLQQLKDLFLCQLDYIEHHVPSFTRVRPEALAWLRQRTKDVHSLEAFGALLMFPVPNRDMGMRLLHTTANVHPIENTCFPFGSGSFGSYTLRCQSHCGRMGFVFYLCRVEVACPLVLQQRRGALCTTDAALYYCTGTVFALDPSVSAFSLDSFPSDRSVVRSIPHKFLLGRYTSLGTNTFELEAHTSADRHPDGEWVSVTLVSRRTGELHLTCQWDQGIVFATVSQNTLPFYDGPHEGHPMVGHIGLLRWSMTCMTASFSMHFPSAIPSSAASGAAQPWAVVTTKPERKAAKDRDESCQGLGWLSHQWQRGQPSPNGLYRFWDNVQRKMATPPRFRVHLRLYIQLYGTEGPQYIVHTRLKPCSFRVGQTLMCTLYKFQSFRPPVFEQAHPFVLRVRTVFPSSGSDTELGSVSGLKATHPSPPQPPDLPSEFEIVDSAEALLPRSSRIRMQPENRSGSHDESSLSHVFRLPMPDRSCVVMCPAFVFEPVLSLSSGSMIKPRISDCNATRMSLPPSVHPPTQPPMEKHEPIGFAWMEITNADFLRSKTSADKHEAERIRSLLSTIETETTKNNNAPLHPLNDSTDSIDLWKQTQDDVSVWYSVFFILFLILSFICAVMFVLIPFTDSSSSDSSSLSKHNKTAN